MKCAVTPMYDLIRRSDQRSTVSDIYLHSSLLSRSFNERVCSVYMFPISPRTILLKRYMQTKFQNPSKTIKQNYQVEYAHVYGFVRSNLVLPDLNGTTKQHERENALSMKVPPYHRYTCDELGNIGESI